MSPVRDEFFGIKDQVELFVLENWPWPASGRPRLEKLAGDGSDRIFIRAALAGRTALAVIGPDPAENRAYLEIGGHLWRTGEWGPEFFGFDPDQGFFLIEDLGSTHLADSDDPKPAYRDVIGLLADFHARGRSGFDPAWCCQTRRYDRELILERELNYFQAAFFEGYLGLSASEPGLEAEKEALAQAALTGAGTALMHRDFQSRNIMIKNGRPRMIDFQGARLGPPGYDLASLLYDPYAGLKGGFRAELKDLYLKSIALDRKAFEAVFPFLAACRLFQALGAYGFLTRVKGKKDFARFIRPALADLVGLWSGKGFSAYPGLKRLLERAVRKMEDVS